MALRPKFCLALLLFLFPLLHSAPAFASRGPRPDRLILSFTVLLIVVVFGVVPFLLSFLATRNLTASAVFERWPRRVILFVVFLLSEITIVVYFFASSQIGSRGWQFSILYLSSAVFLLALFPFLLTHFASSFVRSKSPSMIWGIRIVLFLSLLFLEALIVPSLSEYIELRMVMRAAPAPDAFSQAEGNQIKPRTGAAYEFVRIEDCASKVLKLSDAFDLKFDARPLEDDMFYVLDGEKGELYFFTPYFAGKTDLTHDREGKSFALNEAFNMRTYNIRIPYRPQKEGKLDGYFYLTLRDMENASGTQHDARINSIPRFLKGDAESKPVFTNPLSQSPLQSLSPKPTAGNGAEYHSLDIEDALWNQNAQNNYSNEAKSLLTSVLATKLATLRGPLTATPQASGHLGEDWEPGPAIIALNTKMREDGIETCKAVSDEFHLNLFPSPHASQSNEIIKLTLKTDPPGAWCRCTGNKYGAPEQWPTNDTAFIVDKTPGSMDVQKGLYRSLGCECTWQQSANICRMGKFNFTGELGGRMLNDMDKLFTMSDSIYDRMGNCASVDPVRCKTDSDCMNSGAGMCFRKDVVGINFSDLQRQNQAGCVCLKGACQPQRAAE